MNPINKSLKEEIKKRLVDVDDTSPFNINPEFLLEIVWMHLPIHTKELLKVPGCCWHFGQSTRGGNLSPILLIRYHGTALLAYATHLDELSRLCQILKLVTGVSQVQVMGVDNCIRCYFDDYSKSWIYDSLPIPSDWQEEAHG